MRALSVADQDAAIQRLFPAFTLTCAFDFMGKWRGPLRPLARTYEIGIAYFPRVHFAGHYRQPVDHGRGARPGERTRPARYRRDAAAHLPSLEDDVGLVTLSFRPEEGRLGAAQVDRRDHHPLGSRMALLLRGLADRRPLDRRR
jgi:hypothetical protein